MEERRESALSFRDGLLVTKGKHWAGWETLQARGAELGWSIWFHRADLITFRNFIFAEKKQNPKHTAISCSLHLNVWPA